MIEPPGRKFHALTVTAMALGVLGVSAPGGYVLFIVAAIYFWLVLGLLWLLRGLAALLVHIFSQPNPPQPKRRAWNWSVFPAIGVATFLIVAVNIPVYVMFWVSKPAMDRLARNAIAVGTNGNMPEPTGFFLFPVSDVEYVQGMVRFRVRGPGLLVDAAGFAYSPDRLPPNISGEDYYTPLANGWYEWVVEW